MGKHGKPGPPDQGLTGQQKFDYELTRADGGPADWGRFSSDESANQYVANSNGRYTGATRTNLTPSAR